MRHRPWSVWLRPITDLAITLICTTTLVIALLGLAPGAAHDALDAAHAPRPDGATAVRAWTPIGLDLGTSVSYRPGAAVGDLIAPALGRTLAAVGVGVVLAFLLAAASVRVRRRAGGAGRAFVALIRLGSAIPGFLLAVVAWRLAAARFGFDYSALHVLTIGAILAVADAGLADLSRRLESEVRHVEDEHHVVAARANQDRPLAMIARTLAGPLLEQIAARFSLMLGAAMMIEIPLQTNGIGQLFAEAVAQRDAPVVVVCMAALAAIVAIVHALKRLCLLALDPRMGRAAVTP